MRDRPPIDAADGRRALDLAEGVLIVLRPCTADQAFAELVATAQQRSVSLFALAEALVDLASGQCRPDTHTAVEAARSQWAYALDRRLTADTRPPVDTDHRVAGTRATQRRRSGLTSSDTPAELCDVETHAATENCGEIAQLRQKLISQPLIEQAKGMLMQSLAVSADDAFDLMKSLSQDCNVKLRDVARRVVEDCTSGRRRPDHHLAQHYLESLREDLRSICAG